MLITRERKERLLREAYAKPKKRKLKKPRPAPPPRPRGRPRRCFDMETAKTIVRSEGICSSVQYAKWFTLNNPAKMPKNPRRAYSKQWTGWGDFLGVYNTKAIGTRIKYRSLEDARSFVRSLGLTSIGEWHDYSRSGKRPTDIPSRPDIVYASGKRTEYWLSWKNFLGYGSEAATADIISATAPVLYIAKSPYTTNMNVYIINIIPGGRAGLVDHITKLQFKLIRAYYLDMKFNHKQILSTLSNHNASKDEYIITNIYELIETFDDNLSKVV